MDGAFAEMGYRLLEDLNADCKPIFIGGEGRSGTTLLRVILDSHPNISCGPETHFFIDEKIQPFCAELADRWQAKILEYYDAPPEHVMARCFGAILNAFHTPYMRSRGKKRWADKTPHNILKIDFLNLAFPNMKFIHIIRDGRDVAASLLEMPWGPKTVEEAAESWRACIKSGIHFGASHENYLEVKYEDLVQSFESTLVKIFSFLDEPWSDQVLHFNKLHHDLGTRFSKESSAEQVTRNIYTSKVNRWKTDLTADQVEKFVSIAGEYLLKLGYEL